MCSIIGAGMLVLLLSACLLSTLSAEDASNPIRTAAAKKLKENIDIDVKNRDMKCPNDKNKGKSTFINYTCKQWWKTNKIPLVQQLEEDNAKMIFEELKKSSKKEELILIVEKLKKWNSEQDPKDKAKEIRATFSTLSIIDANKAAEMILTCLLFLTKNLLFTVEFIGKETGNKPAICIKYYGVDRLPKPSELVKIYDYDVPQPTSVIRADAEKIFQSILDNLGNVTDDKNECSDIEELSTQSLRLEYGFLSNSEGLNASTNPEVQLLMTKKAKSIITNISQIFGGIAAAATLANFLSALVFHNHVTNFKNNYLGAEQNFLLKNPTIAFNAIWKHMNNDNPIDSDTLYDLKNIFTQTKSIFYNRLLNQIDPNTTGDPKKIFINYGKASADATEAVTSILFFPKKITSGIRNADHIANNLKTSFVNEFQGFYEKIETKNLTYLQLYQAISEFDFRMKSEIPGLALWDEVAPLSVESKLDKSKRFVLVPYGLIMQKEYYHHTLPSPMKYGGLAGSRMAEAILETNLDRGTETEERNKFTKEALIAATTAYQSTACFQSNDEINGFLSSEISDGKLGDKIEESDLQATELFFLANGASRCPGRFSDDHAELHNSFDSNYLFRCEVCQSRIPCKDEDTMNEFTSDYHNPYPFFIKSD